MTLDELITAERQAIDQYAFNMGTYCSRAKRQRAYWKMRLISAAAQRSDLPNDVPVADAWMVLCLRARDVLGISEPAGFYLPPEKRKRAA